MEERKVVPELFEPFNITAKTGPSSKRAKRKDIGINVSNMCARWNEKNDSDRESCLTLSNISLQVKEGQLVAVVGAVGSGKVPYKYLHWKNEQAYELFS